MAYNDEVEQEVFDLNDPRLMDDTPQDWDDTAGIEDVKFAPPDDGSNWVVLHLAEQVKEDKPSVYVKGVPGDTKVLARVQPRLLKEDGTEGAFLRDYYPSTQIFQGQRTSHLAWLCQLAGKPLARGMTNKQIVGHVKELFEAAGEKGIVVLADTRWNMSYPTPRLSEDGQIIGVETKNGQTQYTEVKGQKKIVANARKLAKIEAGEAGLEGEAFDRFVEAAEANAHVYVEPVSGEERTVRLEINRLLASSEDK